jgi:chemotaxis family two-component system response regulator Rcp1
MSTGIKISGRAIQILHVEDNYGDANILKQVLRKAGFAHQLTYVNTGEAALDFLNQRNTFANAPRPDVILLDLKLPGKDGLTILNEIRQSSILKSIQVIILTSSESDLDMEWATRLKADHYVVKPMELEEYGELVKILRQIWLKTFHKQRP